MYSVLRSAAVYGVDGFPVRVETDLCDGLPCFAMVGLLDAAAREARERVVSAVRNSGFPFPDSRIVVNLAPAERRKGGSHLDLPIALGVLRTAGTIAAKAWTRECCVLGELALDGTLRPVRGILALALAAQRGGAGAVLVPRANAAEAALTGMRVFAAASLAEAARLFALEEPPVFRAVRPANPPLAIPSRREPDLAEVCGQALARRALEICAAGGHNLLMMGPPGAGKSMLARRLPGILPPLARPEALEVMRIHSVAGTAAPVSAVTTARPFRAPHATASTASMIGGGAACRPGEVVLAHRGVLFLDEFPEFRRDALEALRQPLEDKTVTVTRVRDVIRFPADFTLVAAMNPCPCGKANTSQNSCMCRPPAIRRYRSRISGPLLDRLDLQIELSPLPFGDWRKKASGECSAAVLARVLEAREAAGARLGRAGGNAGMDAVETREHCSLDGKGLALVEKFMAGGKLSARGVDRVTRVARTIADLAGTEKISAMHVAEALYFRGLEGR